MGLCKPNRNRRAYLKGPSSSYLNKVVEKESTNPNASLGFLIETLASIFWTCEFRKQKKEILLQQMKIFGFCTKQSLWHQQMKILLVFLCEIVANQLQQSKGLLWS